MGYLSARSTWPCLSSPRAWLGTVCIPQSSGRVMSASSRAELQVEFANRVWGGGRGEKVQLYFRCSLKQCTILKNFIDVSSNIG